jgi:hypothetical protein
MAGNPALASMANRLSSGMMSSLLQGVSEAA